MNNNETKEAIQKAKEDIRGRSDLFELCQALGLEPKGKVARCPAHNDQGRPNLALYPDNVHCFVCDWGGDAFELVMKARRCDFNEAFDFLAGRLGLPLIGDLRKSPTRSKGQGLGNRGKGSKAKAYPKPSPAAPLPSTPSPTLGSGLATVEPPTADQVEGLGYEVGVEVATVYPKSSDDDRLLFPLHLWRKGLNSREALDLFDQYRGDYQVALVSYGSDFAVVAKGEDPSQLDDQVEPSPFATYPPPWSGGEMISPPPPQADQVAAGRRSLRAEVFAALLDLGVKASTTTAGEWLHREKGIEPATQDAFGLVYLDDPKGAAVVMVKMFGLEALLNLGIYGKTKEDKTYFGFKTHRLLFPFFWKGEPVDVQGRDVETTDKNRRFRNTGGKNPLPYNADALLEARATGAPVFLCEGATDTLALAQSGRLAVGIVGTGGFKSSWLPAFEGLTVYLALDADEAGQEAAKKITKVFVGAGHPAPKTVKLPSGVKDVNELFRSKAK